MSAQLSIPRVVAGLARARPWHFVTSCLSILSHYGVILLPGLVLKAFFDALTSNRPAGFDAYTLCALMAGVTVMNAAQSISGVLEPTLNASASLLQRRNILAAVLRRPAAQALPASPGETVGRLRSDVESISTALTWTADPLGQVFLIATAVIALSAVNALVTVVVILPTLLVMLLVNTLGRRIRAYRENAQQASANVMGFIAESFGVFSAIKGAGAEDRMTARFRQLCDLRRRALVKDVVLADAIDAVAGNLSTIATGALLLVVARLMAHGNFSVGDFAIFVSYLARIATATSYVGNYATIYQQLGVSLRRLEPLLVDAPPNALVERHAVRPPKIAHPGPALSDPHPLQSLEVRGLTFRHVGGGGIEGVSFSLQPGTLTVITGRVGSGKTTLVRALLGLLPRQAGEIEWNGQLVNRPDLFMVPPRCAFTPQVPRLFSASLRENILMDSADDDGILERAAHAAVLEQDLPQLDNGYETQVGPRGVRLSGGQLQRVAAARMFARRSQLLVFDDLSSALDVETEAEMYRRIIAEGARHTYLTVSHRHAVLNRADLVLVIDEGRIVATGRAEELLKRSEQFRAIWARPEAPETL